MAWNIIIAGGGTGGHIFPAIAIAQAIQAQHPDARILFVGANGKMEMEKVPQAGYDIVGLDIAGFNRSNILKNISLPLKLLKSRIRAKRIIREFKPDVVIGVGGFASFPMLNAAQSIGVPTLIQEQNSRAGRSNIILSRKAKTVCTAYEGMDKYFTSGAKIVLTGNPVRRQIKQQDKTNAEIRDARAIPPEAKVVFIVGGSLGASSINRAIEAHCEEILEDENVHIFWQTGKNDYDRLERQYSGKERVRVFDFIKNIEELYEVADVIISRAGAMAISELCIAGKPVIFVPYPYAAENHQTVNADYLVSRGAAVRIPDSLVEEKLTGELKNLIQDDARRVAMSEAIKQLAIKDADERIFNEIQTLIK